MDLLITPSCPFDLDLLQCEGDANLRILRPGTMGPWIITGAYAKYISVSAKMCIHKPVELTFEEAAGIPEVC